MIAKISHEQTRKGTNNKIRFTAVLSLIFVSFRVCSWLKFFCGKFIFMSELDILAIFAHPDDMELSVGGTLLKMKSLGYRTGALDVTGGEMGTRGTAEGRAAEADEAARILKLDVRENLGLPDGHVWSTDETRTRLVRVLRRLKPKIILTHQHNDPHPDHNQIAQLAREGARLASMQKYDGDSGQERINVPMVAHNVFSRLVAPSFIVDVSGFLEEKMNAIRAGMLADLVVHSKDLLAIPHKEILTTEPVLTIFNGRVIYEKN